MSVWMTDTVTRWSLRFCRGRFPWKQRRCLVTASFKDADLPIHPPQRFWGSTRRQTCLSRSLVGAVRFHSQGGNRAEELEENIHLPSQSADVQLDLRQATSPFMSHLQQCRSPSDILDLTCKYSPADRQISSSLTSMWSSLKTMTDEQRRYELRLMREHPEFDRFLQRVLKSVHHLHNNDITYSLLSMVNMGIPHRSRVVQTFLRACQERLNDFDEKSLSILASSLEHMEDSPNVDALKKGMRLSVVALLPGIKNVMTLQILMRLCGKDAPKDLKEKLERKALSMTDQFSVPNAQYMISTMAKMGFYSKPLIHVCVQKITENLHNIPFNRLYALLQSCNDLYYQDLDLFTEVSDYVSSTFDMWTNRQLLLFLSVFGKLHFSPAALMEAYAEKVMENPDALTLQDLLCVLKVYSSLNFDLKHRRQQFLDSVSCAVGSYLPKMTGLMLLKAAYGFCLLNHFPSALLEQLLQTSVLEQIQEKNQHSGQERMLHTVDLCLRLDRPPLPRPLSVPSSVLGRFAPVCPEVVPRLSQALQQLVAGRTSTELQEVVVVENVYVLDGVLTEARSNQTCSSAEQPAEGAQRVAVIYASNYSFCFGSSNPRGPLAAKLRHLKALGYTSVLVTEQDLQPESQEERADVLRRQIFPDQTSEAT